MAKYSVIYNGELLQIPFTYSEITDNLDELRDKDLKIEDIYKITLWKINRYPFINDDIIKKINSLRLLKSHDEKKTREVLIDLLNITGVRLPMASTYLRFTNPDLYQIIDVRAYRAAFDYKKSLNYTYASINTYCDIYLEYLKRLREIATNGYYGITVKFQDLDRFLYDIDKIAGFTIKDEPQDNNIVEKLNNNMGDYLKKIISKGLKK